MKTPLPSLRLAFLLAFFSLLALPGRAQTLPGDSLVFGPMFSPIYHDSVRVWVLTKTQSTAAGVLTMEVKAGSGPALSGTVHDTDTRLGYQLRSYVYAGLTPGQTYTATVKRNGLARRTKSITHGAGRVSDFEFLAGGCGRIMDLSRCVDRVEAASHINGTTDIYKRMAGENSDLMVWLGDAVYLFGVEHSNGLCPGMVNDWDNREALFSRYFFNRKFHDTLLTAMPQLAITDNHDTGGNEFNKTMPTLGISRDNFKKWWPNPQYKNTVEGPGLYSSYKYKDVEFFLLDNRSYRGSTTQHLGPEQLAWLKQALRASTAPFKVLVSGTPSFGKHHGGRNFAITAECDELLRYVKQQNIDGVLCYSADIHQQEFFSRYNDHTYPFFDVVSGNLTSDIGAGNTNTNRANDILFEAWIQTYTRTNVYGQPGDRRYKIEYVSPNGVVYFASTIHEDMLRSVDDSTRKVALGFGGNLLDASRYRRPVQGTALSYGPDHLGAAQSALVFDGSRTALTLTHAPELDLHDRTFSVACWVQPTALPATGSLATLLSNAAGTTGLTLALDAAGHPTFVNHATGQTYTAAATVRRAQWVHLTWQYDNVKQQLMLYYNGSLAQKWSNVAVPVASTAALTVGRGSAGNSFRGSLDELRLYGKLVTERTVATLSGYEPHRGTALSLGGSQNVVIPSAEINATLSGAYTLEFWARVSGDPGTSAKLLASNGRVSNNTTGLSLEFSAANKVNLAYGTNGSGWLNILEGGPAWQPGEWHHVALAANPADSLRLFVDGSRAGAARYAGYVSNTFGLSLGGSTQYGNGMQGELDEVRIWNLALPLDSLRRRMHYQPDGPETGLQYYYDCTANTPTTIRSRGARPYELTLTNAALSSSTAPVATLARPYRAVVAGSWSLRRATATGLRLHEAITTVSGSLVAGRNPDNTVATLSPGSPVQYLRGGWQLDALNLPLATLDLDLATALPNFATIRRTASEYYLLKADAAGALSVANTGYYDGQSLRFLNTFLEPGVYHLGWKADGAAPLFRRGGALALQSNHAVVVPSAPVNTALSGPFTVELWARLLEDPATYGKLLGKSSSAGGRTSGFELEFRENNNVQAILGTNGAGWNTITSNAPWQLGEWNHVAITAAPNDTFKLYVNGQLAGRQPVGSYVPNTYDLALGNNLYNPSRSVAMLDELRIWNRVKSAADIRNQMHLALPAGTPALAYNYTFDQLDRGHALSLGSQRDSVALVNAQLVPSTAPIGRIDVPRQQRVTGSWSLQEAPNSGLAVLAAMADFDTNLVLGKDAQTGNAATPNLPGTSALRTLWQLDALKLSQGAFEFDGPAVLGADWLTVKNGAVEFYLLRQNSAGDLQVESVGTENNDKISFTAVNLGYGLYTLGWKNSVTGLVDTAPQGIRFFPNPSQDFVTLAGLRPQDVSSLAVHSLTGQRVAVRTQAAGQELRLDVAALSPGVYMVVVTRKNGGEKFALRFIKQ